MVWKIIYLVNSHKLLCNFEKPAHYREHWSVKGCQCLQAPSEANCFRWNVHQRRFWLYFQGMLKLRWGVSERTHVGITPYPTRPLRRGGDSSPKKIAIFLASETSVFNYEVMFWSLTIEKPLDMPLAYYFHLSRQGQNDDHFRLGVFFVTFPKITNNFVQ